MGAPAVILREVAELAGPGCMRARTVALP